MKGQFNQDHLNEDCKFFLEDLRCTNHTSNIEQSKIYEKIYYDDVIDHQEDLIYFPHQFHQSDNQAICADDLPEDDENQVRIQHQLINYHNHYHHHQYQHLDCHSHEKLINLSESNSDKNIQHSEEISEINKNSSGKVQQKKMQNQYQLPQKWIHKMNGLLEQKKINQFSTKHNRNMAKFFVRIFSKHLKNFADINDIQTQLILQKLNNVQNKKSISLNDLQELFGGQNSIKSREYLFRILRQKLNQQIIKSQDIQNKNAYILCSKVYRLRCLSRHLISRLQSR